MRILIILLILIGFMPQARASVVHLKDGRSAEGAIVEQNNKNIKMNVDGVELTYYADEIQDIDGQPFNAVQAGGSGNPAAPPAPAVSAEKKALILKFMEVTKLRENMDRSFEFMRKSIPELIKKNLPEDSKKDFSEAKFGAMVDKIFDMDKIFNVDEMVALLVPVYDRNLSAQDLQGLINFYQSDIGRKYVLIAPVIQKETMQFGMELGQSLITQQTGQPAAPAVPTASESAAVNPDKKALILKLMGVTGSREKMIESFNAMKKNFPPETTQMMDKINVDDFLEKYTERMIPVYDRNLSTEDLQGLINFDNSDLGRKLTLVLPIIMKESMQANQAYVKSKLSQLRKQSIEANP